MARECDLARGGLQSGQGAQEFRLPVAGDSGDADDLSRRDLEVDVREGAAGQTADEEAVAGGRLGQLGGKGLLDLTADDQPQHLVVGHRIDQRRAADGSVAHHGDAVGDLTHLGEAV